MPISRAGQARRRLHRSIGPQTIALAISRTAAATASTTKNEFGMPKVDDPPMTVMASGMPRIVVWPIASSSARPLQMLERSRSDDERMRQASGNVDDAVDGADRGTREKHGKGREAWQGHEQRGIRHPEHKPADDGRKGQLALTGEVDTSGQNHQVLPDRHDSDHRRLGDDVAKIPGLRKFGGKQADYDCKHDEDQQRADAQGSQA